MYGERYTNHTGSGPSPPLQFPQLVVYTSPDMMAWTYHGLALTTWPSYPYGTQFTPWAVYDTSRNRFVLWWNDYEHGCCSGGFATATSQDGIHFTVANLNIPSVYPSVDCNSIFIDDDGTGYVAYSSLTQDHHAAIDILSPDLTNTSGRSVALFPDRYVEGSQLFKRNGIYYYAYGSCCCFCRGGSGLVVYQARNISGPWVRQPFDLNCNATDPTAICGAYGDRDGGGLNIAGQGIGLSFIELADGTTAILWQAERWLSAPNNPPLCPDECQSSVGPCADPPNYIKGHGFSYWVPLSFDADGNVLPLAPFVDSFTLDIADADSVSVFTEGSSLQ